MTTKSGKTQQIDESELAELRAFRTKYGKRIARGQVIRSVKKALLRNHWEEYVEACKAKGVTNVSRRDS